ncbi:hypothetical protein SR914_23285 [Comamonas testosteroni]|uniref:DUF3102 domain-containing protein n=1 Tax=Comamonas testosteroni (strain DSM 14576 / KF-1) TaxID=399795 RepID=B7WXT3_COMTK|nr:hypothetical protein [Comamonas testosteroni]EED67935.1 hypothetical protein CtesDRAFT_PD2881 [Comamonas testosteroni KF-1]WQG66052.1 hypothetical protein SR914_23285 [Comamonas testosteroni]
MGRTATKSQGNVTDVVLDKNAVAAIESAQDALAVVDQQAQVQARAVAKELRYEGSMNPDALENGARDSIRRINVALFELGGYLLMMRAACPHGDFAARLARLDLQPRVAQQYMQVTRRFSNANSNSQIGDLGKTKLLEMLVLDDEQIDELALTGETGELKLDEIATMSVKELRSALRQSKEDNKFLAEKRDKEQQRADNAEKALKSGGPKARSLEARVADFSKEVDTEQEAATNALLAMDQQVKALDTWYLEYAAQQPGYEPGDRVDMPVEVLALVQKLCGNVNRIAASVGGLQHLIGNTFGHELEAVTIHEMKTPAMAEAE